MCGVAGLVDVIGDAFETVFEASVAFAEAFAQLRQLLAAEQDEDNDREDHEVHWSKEFTHNISPCSPVAWGLPPIIVAQLHSANRYGGRSEADVG